MFLVPFRFGLVWFTWWRGGDALDVSAGRGGSERVKGMAFGRCDDVGVLCWRFANIDGPGDVGGWRSAIDNVGDVGGVDKRPGVGTGKGK